MPGTLRLLLTGGLGNQLFQWAAAETLLADGIDYTLDARYVQTPGQRGLQVREVAGDRIRHDHDSASARHWLAMQSGRISREILRHGFPEYSSLDELRSDLTHCARSGSIKARGELQDNPRIFRMPEIRRKVLATLTNETRPSSGPYGVVHARRGDYIANPEYLSRFGICSTEYYLKGIEMLAAVQDWYVISDDESYAAELASAGASAGLSLTPLTGGTQNGDLATMAHASALVISNSTYSWWGAHLSGIEDVVYPQPWLNQEHSICFGSAWMSHARGR